MKMQTSLIATVQNEERSIRAFLDALLAQSKTPDEIIITDGGSTDGTLEIIRSYVGSGAPIKVMVEHGANIARGRNLAIREARGDVIACTDAGSRADPGWLEELTSPFEDPKVDVACGFSVSDAQGRKEESFGILMLGEARHVDAENPNPSSRSVAFRKSVWEKAGGYPEELQCAEDSLFNRRMREAGARFVFCTRALVYWRPPGTIPGAMRKFFRYGRGDGRVRLFERVYATILFKVALVLGLIVAGAFSSVFWLVLFASFLAYYLRTLHLNRHRGSPSTNSLVFINRLFLDASRFAGYLLGRIERWRNPRFRRLSTGRRMTT